MDDWYRPSEESEWRRADDAFAEEMEARDRRERHDADEPVTVAIAPGIAIALPIRRAS